MHRPRLVHSSRTTPPGSLTKPRCARSHPPCSLEGTPDAAIEADSDRIAMDESENPTIRSPRTRVPRVLPPTPSSYTQRISPRRVSYHPSHWGNRAKTVRVLRRSGCSLRNYPAHRRGRRLSFRRKGNGRSSIRCGSNYYLPCIRCFTPSMAAKGPAPCHAGRRPCRDCSAGCRVDCGSCARQG